MVSISATKSMMGHLLGAAGAVESIICILAIRDSEIPATINLHERDEQIEELINIVTGKSIYKEVNYALNNSFGFGGHTASSIFKKYKN